MRIGGKRIHWSVAVVGGILGLLLLIQLVSYFFLQPLVGTALKKSINYFTDGLYQFDYEKINVRLFNQSITINGVVLSYDTARVNHSAQLQQQKFYAGTIDHLDVKFRDFDYFLSGRYLAIDVADVNSPALFVHQYPALRQPDTTQSSAPLEFNTFKLISPYFDSVAISLVSVKRATLGLVRHRETGLPDSTTINELGMRVVNALVDSVAAEASHGWPAMEEARLWLRDQTFSSPDSLYDYRVDSLGVDPLREEILARRISVIPRWSRYEMGQRLDKLTTWMERKVDQVNVRGIDFPLLTDSLIVRTRSVSVDQLEVTLFRDLRLPSGEPQARPLLPDLLKSVPTPFRVDTLTLANTNLRYEERRESAEQAGHITFADLYASLYNITNQTHDSTLVLEADVRMRLMDEGQAELHFEFPLTSPRGEHRIQGKMYRMPLTELNPAVEPLAFASVKSGVANQLDFDMRLDNQSATGNVRFQYENFKVSLLKENAPDKKRGVKSWLANWLVVKNSNPAGSKPLRPGPINVQRDSTQSMVRYWWLALRSGLMVSVGVGSAPDDKEAVGSAAE
ncbi:MAG: DUF748 domain-containing protein [Tunicatimonas sp.]